MVPVIEEYERLRADKNYTDVKIDRKSGGLSAVHREHNFDPTKGCFGIPRGEYERLATEALRKNGYRVVLASEKAGKGTKTPDGSLDGVLMDIKAVEGTSKYTIKNKFDSARRQRVKSVILYFHTKELYSEERVADGWRFYMQELGEHSQPITNIVCVVEDKVIPVSI